MPETESNYGFSIRRNIEIEMMIDDIVSNRQNLNAQDLDAEDLDAMDAEDLTVFLRGLPRRELSRLHRSLDL